MTLERITRGNLVPPWVHREHEARYAFAATFAEGRVIVDCASGEGRGSDVLVRAKARRVIAVDLDLRSVATAAAAAPVDAICGDGTFLPLASGIADLFVALETIEHIEDAQRFLSEARRCLRPGGVLVCSTPNRLVTNPGTSMADRPFNAHHVREYAPHELMSDLARHFTKISLYGQVPQRRGTTAFYRTAALMTTPRLAARLRQLTKLPRFAIDNDGRYTARAIGHRDFEYLIAVCVV